MVETQISENPSQATHNGPALSSADTHSRPFSLASLTEGRGAGCASRHFPRPGQSGARAAESLQEPEQRLLGDFAPSAAQLPEARQPPARAEPQRLGLEVPVARQARRRRRGAGDRWRRQGKEVG